MDTERIADRAERREARRAGRSRSGGIVFGAVIVAAGLILLLDNLGILHAHDVWKYWPVALIAAGVARIVESRRPGALVWGGVMAGVGALLLLDRLNILDFDARLFWPLIIIGVGVTMLLRSLDRNGAAFTNPGSSDSTIGLYGVFAGGKRRVESHNFQGGDILALFSGYQVDLRGAKIGGPQAVIDVNSIFGGVEIFVPADWRVTTKGIGIFGNFEDKTLPTRTVEGVATPELVVTGCSVFGGATIRN